MLVDGLFVQRVDLGHLGAATGGKDVLGDCIDRPPATSREENVGPFARKGPRDRTADRASGSIDHGVLVLQQHGKLPLCCTAITAGSVGEIRRRSSLSPRGREPTGSTSSRR